MTFKKGQSGNPKGRDVNQKKQKLTLQLFGKDTEDAAKIIRKHLNSGVPDYEYQAAKLILEYVCGKPTQNIDANVQGSFVINFSTPTKK